MTQPCHKCGGEVLYGGKQCHECRHKQGVSTVMRWQREHPLAVLAMKLVSKAVRRGDLAPPDTLKCVDCGCEGRQYDHRDYTKPLDVVPVCTRCNQLRGPGHPYITAVS